MQIALQTYSVCLLFRVIVEKMLRLLWRCHVAFGVDKFLLFSICDFSLTRLVNFCSAFNYKLSFGAGVVTMLSK